MGYLPWYQYNRIDNYAFYPDPEGPFPKPDSNIIGLPNGTPITAVGAGVVSGINSPLSRYNVPSWGQVITVKLDRPYNDIATHMAYLHLGLINPLVRVGQHVNFGDILGYSGQSVSGAAPGFAFYNGDYYGYGPSWSKYVGSPALNPVPFLSQLQLGGNVSTLGGGNTNTTYLNNNLTSANSGNIVDNINSLGSIDWTRFIDATLLFIIGIALIVVGALLLMQKSGITGAIAKTAMVAA